MATLSKEHRKLLENTVAAARSIAVVGARKALLALRIGEKEAPADANQKDLRSQLRAHGRQLGDRRQPSGTQETLHLEQACAYEHWHRLLFARFLAENDLLINPEFRVPMSLAEIQETAREQKCDWLNLASEYAQQMLLEVFHPDDPVLCVALPPETRQQLEEKLALLPAEVFRADDSLGWVYQHWQRDEKERVNKSEVKIGADELPAVTQLFTEDYMVLFLLENTLGSWWAAKRRSEGKDAALSGYEWTYLRLNEDGSPAARGLDGWPRAARDLRVLDPSMGSGHFLSFALPILARMRIEEEGLSLRDAIYAALRDNLFGLELDARCSQIAAFNLALTAWRLAGEHFQLPQLNLACSGLGIHAPEADWVKLAGEDGAAREEMRRLYSLFKDAPTLGSLIDPLRLQANVFAAGAERVLPLLEEALKKEHGNDETRELVIAAQGVLAAFRILASRFTLVVTNVPYLGRGKQDDELAKYCAEFHSDAKADLATCFVDRCLRFCEEGGSAALVTPQNWLFLGRYSQFRARLLKDVEWISVVKLGPNAFQDMNWWAATTALAVISNRPPLPAGEITSWDVGDVKAQTAKMELLLSRLPQRATQASQLTNPDHRITMGDQGKELLLRDYAGSYVGVQNGDAPRFVAYFWEIPRLGESWSPLQLPCDTITRFGGREGVLFWQGGSGELARSDGLQLKGREAWGKPGVAVRQTRHLPATLYSGEMYDQSSAVIIPADPSHLPAVWAFCISGEFHDRVREVDPKVQVTNGTMVKVPFDLPRWQAIAADEFPDGLPKPFSSDATQWLFSGRPDEAENALQVAIARLVGYKWPRQTGSSFPDCAAVGDDGLDAFADQDGIVCFEALAGEESATIRLRHLLEHAFAGNWSAQRLAQLLGKNLSLEDWLKDAFFEDHCRMFLNRPFVWHIWDGREDGFHALVNYHKLTGPNGEGRKTLERLIYTSLGDWINRQEDDVRNGADGAEGRLTAAQHLKTQLINILHGEPPYDLFIRWKPLHQQPIGWEPDINDGARMNIRPWLHAKPYQAPNQKLRQDACILRVTPIKLPLGKDRGKEPLRDKDDFPWYATSQERTNDLHFTLDEKRAARERKKKA